VTFWVPDVLAFSCLANRIMIMIMTGYHEDWVFQRERALADGLIEAISATPGSCELCFNLVLTGARREGRSACLSKSWHDFELVFMI